MVTESTNSPASRDIANLVPILKEMGVTKLGHAMKLTQAVRSFDTDEQAQEKTNCD